MSSSYTNAVTARHREYRFGDFTLDLNAGSLRRGPDEVPLRPKTFAVLAYLVERHGQLVAKAELFDAIWSDAVVTDNSLAQCLVEVRRALKDDSQQIIRTVSRRGYVFVAPLRPSTLPFARRPDDGLSEESNALSTSPTQIVRRPVAGKYWTLFIALAAGITGIVLLRFAGSPQQVTYTQLTHFTDSAASPAVSPDGRMLAFIRGPRTFLDPGQLYVKLLPDGEPFALTHDDHPKMAPVFSPDGSRIAYTVTLGAGKWETWSVSVLGGEPQPLLANAAALTWIGNGRVLFSEIKRDVQMAVVTATAHRSDVRDVYVPRGMAHRSSVSSDQRWVLISSEMNANGWLPCRLAPIEGGPAARIVGPSSAKCTYAAWSPDSRWMYFSAEAVGGFHTWRQRFPDGTPEQITFGATEEEGIAMWPDGRSFASSVGTTTSSIWVHDEGNDRQITSEGFGQLPSFSRDGNTLYYLLRVSDAREWTAGQLWAVDLSTDKRRRVLSGISMAQYDLSDDGTRIVFARTDPGSEGVWLAHLDGRLAPRRLTSDPDTRAFFGRAGTVVFEARDSRGKYLFRMREDGSSREKISADRIIGLTGVSHDRRWAVAWPAEGDLRRLVAYPLDGGHPVPICESCADSEGGPAARGRTPPVLSWSPGGQFLYVRPQSPREPMYESGRTYVVRLSDPGGLPPQFNGASEAATIPGVQVIPHGGLFPGPRESLYAFTRAVMHRNIYRITVP